MSLPITKNQAYSAAKWIKSNFAPSISQAIQGTPFTIDFLCAIACQETAYFWLSFINKLPPDIILARCVLDASGDFPDTKRSEFPKNTKSFEKRYGRDKTLLLISEANETRKMRGFPPEQWVYKGYGLFQYDLQFIISDEDFFFQKKWYSFENCLSRVISELQLKYKKDGDLWACAKAYNGSGPASTTYANNVIQYMQYCSEVK